MNISQKLFSDSHNTFRIIFMKFKVSSGHVDIWCQFVVGCRRCKNLCILCVNFMICLDIHALQYIIFLWIYLPYNSGFHLLLMILRNTIFSFQIQEEHYELLPNTGNALLLQWQTINTNSV